MPRSPCIIYIIIYIVYINFLQVDIIPLKENGDSEGNQMEADIRARWRRRMSGSQVVWWDEEEGLEKKDKGAGAVWEEMEEENWRSGRRSTLEWQKWEKTRNGRGDGRPLEEVPHQL